MVDEKLNEQYVTEATQRSGLPSFTLCGAQGWVCWEEENDSISGPWDHDVVECFTVLLLPFFARRAFHTCNWSSETNLTHFGPNLVVKTDYAFQMHPIRLTGALIARGFLRRWLYVLAGCGLIAAVLGGRLTDRLGQVFFVAIGIGLILLTVICAIRLQVSESRTKRIRRLLGRHRRGSSDPATWTEADCARIPESQELFGYPSFEEAVESLVEKGDYSEAMWAARLSVIKEGRLRGEQLTTRVLRHPDAKRCLAKAEENPKAWLEALQARRAGNAAMEALVG